MRSGVPVTALLMGVLMFRFAPALLAPLLLATPPVPGQAPNDPQIQADAQHQLNKKQFRDVHAEVANGEVTLTGTVRLLADKLDAVFATNINESAQQLIQAQHQPSDNTNLYATRDENGVLSMSNRLRQRYK